MERGLRRGQALVLLGASLLLLLSSLPLSLGAPNKKAAAAAARKEDIPFIRCQVCEKIAHQLHQQVKKEEARISPKKISELQIIEIAENVCNLKKEEADWLLRIDIVEKGDALELVEQESEGQCNSECKTLERACQEVMGYSDTDVAEYMYTSKPSLDSLVKFLCHDLTKSCLTKPPPVPKVRSWPSLSLLSARQPELSPVVRLRLRLSEAPAPLINSAPASGDEVEVRLDREFLYKDLYEFMLPGKAKMVVASMLAASRSVWPDVGEGALAVLVERVVQDLTYSATKAMIMPPCDVTGEVHIIRAPANHGVPARADVVVVGVGLGRALLESREAHEREWGFGGEPASQAAIEALETAPAPGKKGEEDDRCVVCYEELATAPPAAAGEVVVIKKMPCGHLFHGGCIVRWLRRNHRCPLCRFEMPKLHEAAAAPPSS